MSPGQQLATYGLLYQPGGTLTVVNRTWAELSVESPLNISGRQVGGLSANPFNQSGVGHDLAKLATGATLSIQETDGYKESWREGAIAITRRFFVSWSQARQAVTYWLGYSTNIGGNLVRVPPEQHPRDPYLYATEVRLLNGIGAWVNDPSIYAQGSAGSFANYVNYGPSGDPIYDPFTGLPVTTPVAVRLPFIAYAEKRGDEFYDGAALFEVTYSALNYEIRHDDDTAVQLFGELARWTERKYNPAIQGIQLPSAISNQLKFTAGAFANDVIPVNPVLLLPTMAIDYTIHDVPDLNHAAFRACTGRINDVPFDGCPGFGEAFAVGTVLCNPPRYERYRATSGRYSHRVMLNMVFRDVGWNAFPASDGQFYAGAFQSGALLYKYPPAGFSFADLTRQPTTPTVYQTFP